MNRRKTDTTEKAWFQSERFFEHDGKWFFTTREGTTEGPFGDKMQARARLEAYIKVARSGHLGENQDVGRDWKVAPKS